MKINTREVFTPTNQLSENMLVSITNLSLIPFKSADIDSALAAIGYAAKAHLRITESVTGDGAIYGNVMLLDIDIPLDSSNSSNVEGHALGFINEAKKYICTGVLHRKSNTILGGFGNTFTVFLNHAPIQKLHLEIETTASFSEIQDALSKFGTVSEK